MKIVYRTPKIIDVFLDDDVSEKHGWGKWSKFHIHKNKLIFIGGNPLSAEDFNSLKERVL